MGGPLSIPRPILDSHLPPELEKGRVKGSWPAEFQGIGEGDCLGQPQGVQGSAPPKNFLKAIVA